MKKKILFAFSLILFLASVFAPIIGGGGSGEWPCKLVFIITPIGDVDLDCIGNSGSCLCTMFNM